MSGPPDDVKPLIYLARLTNAEKNALYAVGDAFPKSEISKAFHDRLNDLIISRVLLSKNFLDTAQQMWESATTEGEFRVIVNRAYYAIHHSIRAMAFHRNHFEADGHAEAIEELKLLARGKDAKTNWDLDEKLVFAVSEARNNRSVADYSPFSWSRSEKTTNWFGITNDDWRTAARFNLDLGIKLLVIAQRFVGLLDRKGGTNG